MATIRYVSVILILVLLRPVTLVGQDDSYFALRLTDGETLEFPSVAFFQESEDGGTKAICITPQGNGPGLVLIASFDFASIPTVVEEDAVTVLLGTTDPTLGLYGADEPGARMIIPVGDSLYFQILRVVEKLPGGEVEIRDNIAVRFVPLRRN